VALEKLTAMRYKPQVMRIWLIMLWSLLVVGCNSFEPPPKLDSSRSDSKPYYPEMPERWSSDNVVSEDIKVQFIEIGDWGTTTEHNIFQSLYSAFLNEYGDWAGPFRTNSAFKTIDTAHQEESISLIVRTSSSIENANPLNKLELCTAKKADDLKNYKFKVQAFLGQPEKDIQLYEGEVPNLNDATKPQFFYLQNETPPTNPPQYSSGNPYPSTVIGAMGVCAPNRVNAKTGAVESLCPYLLMIIEFKHPSGATHLKGLLYKNEIHHLVPYVDLNLIASTSDQLFDLNDLPLRSAFLTNGRCTIEDILTPSVLPEAYIEKVENDFSQWLEGNTFDLSENDRSAIAGASRQQLNEIKREFLASSSTIIENGLFRRREVVNLATETISQLIETYSGTIEKLNRAVENLKQKWMENIEEIKERGHEDD